MKSQPANISSTSCYNIFKTLGNFTEEIIYFFISTNTSAEGRLIERN